MVRPTLICATKSGRSITIIRPARTYFLHPLRATYAELPRTTFLGGRATKHLAQGASPVVKVMILKFGTTTS